MPTPGPLATLPAPALLVLVWRVSRFVASRRSRARCACLGRALRTRRIAGAHARWDLAHRASRIVRRQRPSMRAYARSSMVMTRGPGLASPRPIASAGLSASPPRPRACLAPENARRFFATWVPPGRYAPARPSVRSWPFLGLWFGAPPRCSSLLNGGNAYTVSPAGSRRILRARRARVCAMAVSLLGVRKWLPSDNPSPNRS